ncbi:hypothetical protein HMPREF9075_00971 [Capnocytophaga sp. oral taxon 332 str. F0381]|nr:hypothetical protein [Capnocytophaga sp. oral taxon 332]EKY10735.1 hypothetical protein HMPREF9075_00971 [Capnocytophaga sp. oral taxon 332 str. F0381]
MTQEPKIFPYIERLLQGTEVVWKPCKKYTNKGMNIRKRYQ